MDWGLVLSLILCLLIAYRAGRVDILRRIWRQVSRREVEEGARYPRGYGFAYYDWPTGTMVAYPVPFNLVVRAARRVWLWYLEWLVSMRRGHSPLDRMLMEAQRSGYKKGTERGVEIGREMFDTFKEKLQTQSPDINLDREFIRAILINLATAEEIAECNFDATRRLKIWKEAQNKFELDLRVGNDDNPPS